MLKELYVKSWSIKSTLIISIMFVGVLSQVASGISQYVTQSGSSKAEISHINDAVMQPIVNLASIGVEGGNQMILTNKEARALYESSKILFMSINGTSAGAAQTSYSDAIPPQNISLEFTSESLSGNKAKAERIKSIALSGKKGLIDGDMLFVASFPLKTKNGGEVVAVFSAEQLLGLEWRVAQDVGIRSFLTMLVAFALAVFIGRRIAGPIEDISRQINEITRSLDLNARVKTSDRHEIGQIADSFNSLIGNLQDVMRDIAKAADQVFVSSRQMSDTPNRIAMGSSQQSERSSATASSIEELSVSISAAADSANDANEASSSTIQTAGNGEQIVREASDEMKKIAGSVKETTEQILALDEGSRQIAGITSLIKEIADQTNLLALNAAIEAARAGDHGRGFAVVADEVHKLAERTAKATKEITVKIESNRTETASVVAGMRKSVKLVEHGVELADLAGDALTEINKSTLSISGMIKDIAMATHEQNSASAEIAKNIEMIARMSDEYDAIVRETKVAMGNLEQQAASLKTMSGRFKGGEPENHVGAIQGLMFF